MPYSFLASMVAFIHFLFVLFVMLGGLLVFWKSGFAWIHLPVAAYGVLIEWVGWVCPLTPLENDLRERAGNPRYEGGFVERYLLSMICSVNSTRKTAVLLGLLVLLLNIAIYFTWWLRLRSGG